LSQKTRIQAAILQGTKQMKHKVYSGHMLCVG